MIYPKTEIRIITDFVGHEMVRQCNIFDHHGFVKTISTKWRKREVVFARQLCYYFFLKFTKLPLESVGDTFGLAQDHSTVIHAKDTVQNLYDTDKKIRATIDRINVKIENAIRLIDPNIIDHSYTFAEFDKREVLN